MLYIIGLGLGDEKDITLRGLEAVRSCRKVYVEAYTSLLSFGISSDGLSKLEELYGKTIAVADREMVEEKADTFLSEASESDVGFLVVGDPFGWENQRQKFLQLPLMLNSKNLVPKIVIFADFSATTHTDLVIRAKKLGVKVEVIHNASVMNAVGACGLQLYRFGETVSIPFFTDSWRPDSFYEKIMENQRLGLHTLCLLDIQVKEPSLEHLCRGKKVYLPPRFMTVNTALSQLLEVEQVRGKQAYSEESKCVGIARLGSIDQVIIAGSMRDLLAVDFGPPLHCLIIVGQTHELEDEMLRFFSLS
ncbi:tetrapyrrole (Corrin/Porphyrin) Methylase isoform X1 [Wolffia australiana]